jgi:excisionase family DNA binding protein
MKKSQEKKEEKADPFVTREFVTRKEVADRLRLSEGSIYNLMKAGELTYYRVGRRILFKVQDILDYLEKHSHPAKK